MTNGDAERLPEPVLVPGEVERITDDMSRRLTAKSEFVWNVSQRYIVIPRDRLKLILTENKSRLVRTEVLLSVAALFASLLLTLLTGSFKDRWAVSAESWEAGFFLCTVVVGLWFIVELVRYAMRRLTVERLVQVIEEADTSSDG